MHTLGGGVDSYTSVRSKQKVNSKIDSVLAVLILFFLKQDILSSTRYSGSKNEIKWRITLGKVAMDIFKVI